MKKRGKCKDPGNADPQSIAREVETAPEEKVVRVQKATVVTDTKLYEEVWDRNSKPRYACIDFNSHEFTEVDSVIIPGNLDHNGKQIIYEPVDNEHLRLGVVIVPQTWEKCTFEQTYKEGCDLALDLYDCEPRKIPYLKLYVAIAQSSIFYDRFVRDALLNIAGMGKYAPIIAARGMSGSGKGRFLNALRFNSYRPFYDQSTSKIPSLFRPMQQWENGTLCLEECDFKRSQETSEFTHFINCRCYGVPISRQNPDSVKESNVFPNFGLTEVTQRRPWEDNATESRTLPFNCETSQKPLATAELDEQLVGGMSIQNKLLYLRMTRWHDFTIDKAARITGLGDHRLTASVLPVISLKKDAPQMVNDILAILLEIERQRREVKAQSPDGQVINAIWDRVEQGYVGKHDAFCYVGYEKDADGQVTPLITSALQDAMNWTGRLGTLLQSLQLADGTPKRTIKLSGGVYRPIWFTPDRLEVRLREFVPDYENNKLKSLLPDGEKVSQQETNEGPIPDSGLSRWVQPLPSIPSLPLPSLPDEKVTEVTKVTVPLTGDVSDNGQLNPAPAHISVDLLQQVEKLTKRTQINEKGWIDRSDLSKEIGFDNLVLLTRADMLETHNENFSLVRLKQ